MNRRPVVLAFCAVLVTIGLGLAWKKIIAIDDEISCSLGPCRKFSVSINTEELVNISIGKDRLKSSWSIPGKYISFIDNAQGGSQPFIYLRVSMEDIPNIKRNISEKCLIAESSYKYKNNSFIRNMTIMINPGISIEKDIAFTSRSKQMGLIKKTPPIYDLDLFTPTIVQFAEDKEIYLRPKEIEKYPETFFHSLRGLGDQNIMAESTVFEPNVALEITYSMCRLEDWVAIDQGVRAFLRNMILID